MHILILTDSYPPEIRSAAELMKDLAEGLVSGGDEVTVVTSRPYHNVAKATGELPLESMENGVRVIRPKVLPHHNVPFVIRGLAQLALPYIFYRSVRKLVHGKIDATIVHSPPLPLTLTSYWLKKSYGARFVLNLQDIFPQNAIDLGVLTGGPALWLFQWMEKKAYRRSDVIVTPSGEHKNYVVQNRGVAADKIHVVPHWMDMRPFDRAAATGRFRKKFGLSGKFVFMFAGVLGPSQALDLVLDVAKAMQKEPQVRFLFVGEGREKEHLMERVKEENIANVVFEPLVPAEEYPELVKEMDVGLVTLTSKNTSPAVPAKLVGYMAGGLPVLALLHPQSEALRIVRDAGCGLGAVSDDAARAVKLAEEMYKEKDKLKEYGRNAWDYARKHFSRDVCVAEWKRILNMQ